MTREQFIDVKQNELPAIKQPNATLQAQWAEFGSKVVARFDDDTYQRLVTYCLLAGGTPAVTANIIKTYITTGKLPWQS